MNKCIFGAARLTRDPEVSQSQLGTTVAKFGIAVNRDYKSADGQPTADFINCVCFNKTAGVAEKYLKKGSKVNLETHVQTDSYTNKDGVKVNTTTFVVDKIEFCESKGSGNNSQPAAAPKKDDFVSVPDGMTEELPFV